MTTRVVIGALVLALLVAACGGGGSATTTTAGAPVTTSTTSDAGSSEPTSPSPTAATTTTAAMPGEGCADVVAVEATPGSSGWTFSVTVASADTGWEKYADAWVVRTQDGDVLGERILTHPHVDEQPFTRSQSGIEIPDGVTTVIVAARDSVVGFCGAEMAVAVDQADG